MADALTPINSATIDYAIRNESGPPIPTPAREQPPVDPSQVDSDTILTAEHDQPGEPPVNENNTEQAPSFHAPPRPRITKRWDTEVPRPVAARPAIPKAQRRSTGARKAARLVPDDDLAAASDSSSEWSEEEEIVTLQRSQTEPDHNPLSATRLNQVRRKPNRYLEGDGKNDKRLKVGNQHFTTLGRVARDGRLTISVNETANTGYLAKALGGAIDRHLHPNVQQEARDAERIQNQLLQEKGNLEIPRMNIVVMVIGSRGDIQPFLKIGKILQDKYNHRVRIATHPTFKKFVEEDVGLEFFSVGGDPAELMAFMVKNPGLVPSFETIKAGEIGRRRESMYDLMNRFWAACINATDDEEDLANMRLMGTKYPFVADAIIANPPSFAHYHCAEKLGCPLHLVFTFPYSPTQAFPHPLANIKTTNVDQSYTNYMSYPLVDLMTWQGLGDLVNRFRIKTLGLEPVSTLWAPGQITRLRVPTTYLWSPGLVPKPQDWGLEIDIAGYVFLDLASKYHPHEDLAKFLDRSDGRPIIYIGFGSISGIDDATAFTKMIFEGVAKANVKAVISRGWGGMGDGLDKPEGVFMIDNVPHDWLFPKVDAVVHHGGAGTTAAGLKFGKPTMIIPFFGDQPFWSAMIAKAGAGSKESLPLRRLNSDKFAKGIKECLEPDAKAKAQEIAGSIAKEGDGAQNAVDSFHRSLPLEGPKSMRCEIFPGRVAIWHVKHTDVRLSALAADLLVENKQMQWSDVALLRHRKWQDFQGPGEPITGAGGVVLAAFQEAFHGLQSIPENAKRDMRKLDKARRKKKGRSVEDAIVLPGRMAQSIRGTSVDVSKKELERLKNGTTLEREPEEPKRTFSKPRRNSTTPARTPALISHKTDSSLEPAPIMIAKDIGKGLGRSTKAIVRLPSDMFFAMTLGFRNAPRLYGDKTVRPMPGNITGFRTGIKTAGSEFYHGVYDGLTGVVMIPVQDVHDNGIAGLPKGFVRGLGGLVLKPLAGTMGLLAYTSRGFWRSMRKRFRDTGKTERWIRRARMAQGVKDIEELRRKEAEDAHAPPPDRRHEGELEDMRSRVLTRWDTQKKELLEQAREKETSIAHVKSKASMPQIHRSKCCS